MRNRPNGGGQHLDVAGRRYDEHHGGNVPRFGHGANSPAPDPHHVARQAIEGLHQSMHALRDNAEHAAAAHRAQDGMLDRRHHPDEHQFDTPDQRVNIKYSVPPTDHAESTARTDMHGDMAVLRNALQHLPHTDPLYTQGMTVLSAANDLDRHVTAMDHTVERATEHSEAHQHANEILDRVTTALRQHDADHDVDRADRAVGHDHQERSSPLHDHHHNPFGGAFGAPKDTDTDNGDFGGAHEAPRLVEFNSDEFGDPS